jgi:hypothetical protein
LSSRAFSSATRLCAVATSRFFRVIETLTLRSEAGECVVPVSSAYAAMRSALRVEDTDSCLVKRICCFTVSDVVLAIPTLSVATPASELRVAIGPSVSAAVVMP